MALHRGLADGTLARVGGFNSAAAVVGTAMIEPAGRAGALTEARFAAGVARLSPEERRMLGKALVRALPILTEAIGSFVEAPIRRLLAAGDEAGTVTEGEISV